MKPLIGACTAQDCQRIHGATLRVLSHVGIDVKQESAREIFREVGANVDRSSRFLRPRGQSRDAGPGGRGTCVRAERRMR
jgi:trimethylamine:corrinoid methyltransferase-like protein